MKTRKAVSTAVAAILVIVLIVLGGAVYYFYYYTNPASSGPKGTIGVVFDVGGKGDLGFNDLAFLGASQAANELGYNVTWLQSPTQNDYTPNLEKLAKLSPAPALIVGVGALMSFAVNQTAHEFPNQKFAIVDGFLPALPNMMVLNFKENEGSAVVGALAAFVADCYSKQGKGNFEVGMVLGIPIPVLYHFEIGYKWGVSWAQNYSQTINSPILQGKSVKDVVLYTYTNSFTDQTLGKQTALAQFQQGAVVSFNVAGATGLGIFSAAQEQGAGQSMGPPFGIGVDSDQDWIAPGFILTSMEKRVDVSVHAAAQMATNGSWSSFISGPSGGYLVPGIKDGGIKMADVADITQFLQIAVQNGKNINQTDITNKINAMRSSVTQACGPVYDYASHLSDLIKSGQVSVPLVSTNDALAYWRSRYG